MRTEDVVLLILAPALLMAGCWLVWVIATNFRRARTARYHAELQSKLLDKLGSSQDLLDYLESRAGQRMLQVVGDQADPAGRVLNAMHIGVVLVMLGIGFLTCDGSLPGPNRVGVFMTLGILSMALGSGFLISSGLAFLFTRAWGLLRERGPAVEAARTASAPRRD